MSFNDVLNVVLPLSLTKGERTKLMPEIKKVDALRKVRNDLVHRTITEEDIDVDVVRESIGAISKILQALRRKSTS